MPPLDGREPTAPERPDTATAGSRSGRTLGSRSPLTEGSLLARLRRTAGSVPLPSTMPGDAPRGRIKKRDAKEEELARKVRHAFYEMFSGLGAEKEDEVFSDRAYYLEKISEAIEEVLKDTQLAVLPEELTRIKEEILVGIMGFGPLQRLLDDPEVDEIMVNGPDHVFVERGGRIDLTEVTFQDNDHLMQVIEKIVIPLGRRCDEGSPLCDARLPDGSRVNVVIPPLSLTGPCLTIRKFSKTPLRLSHLVDQDTLTKDMATFLEGCVRSKLNIIVSGETGSGKTTTLNALSAFLPHDARIISIEDSAELQLQQDHVISLETRQANLEGIGEVTIRDLLKNALRMIPDRIIIGECRGGEALDMLQAMSSGNDGSMTTGHANTPKDMVRRLETMVLMAGMGLPIRAIREQIAGAIDLIVHQRRFKDGSRKVTSITEVSGYHKDEIVIREIFRYVHEGYDDAHRIRGHFEPTGEVPVAIEQLFRDGYFLPDGIFGPEVDIEALRADLAAHDRRMAARQKEIAQTRQNLDNFLGQETLSDEAGRLFRWQDASMMGAGDENSTLVASGRKDESKLAHLASLQQLKEDRRKRARLRTARSFASSKDTADQARVEEYREILLERLPEFVDFDALERRELDAEEERSVMLGEVQHALDLLLQEADLNLGQQLKRELCDDVTNEIAGIGPLQALLDDDDVSEIMVNGPDKVFAERNGRIEMTGIRFRDSSHLMRVIQTILRPIGRRVDEGSPMVDARLLDGSRVNIVIPPAAVSGATLTIRKFSRNPFRMSDLVEMGTLPKEAADFLAACVRCRLNMIVSGGTGSGKTTTLNAMSAFIQDDARIVTIEDAAELRLQQPHVVPLEARQANIEGKGSIPIRRLVVNSLHMRPDRILIGECRGGEALDMLMAMTTGNEGSLTTLHSNSPFDTILRLQTLVMMSGMELPLRAINEQIVNAIRIIVHQERFGDGRRRITHITEVVPDRKGHPDLMDIYRWDHRYQRHGSEEVGGLIATGNVPTLFGRFVEENVQLPQGVFGPAVNIPALTDRYIAEREERARLENERLLALQLAEEQRREFEELPGEGGEGDGRGGPVPGKAFTWKDAVRGRDFKAVDFGEAHHLARLDDVFSKLRSRHPSQRVEENAGDASRLKSLLVAEISRTLDAQHVPLEYEQGETEVTYMKEIALGCLDTLRRRDGVICPREQEEELLYSAISEFIGYGPVQHLMDDSDISEIMINGPDQIFVEKAGRLTLSDARFRSEDHLQTVIQRMLAPVGRRCDLSSPMVDARLPEGSRINAIVPPLSLTGSTLTIRKFSKDPYTIDDLIEMGSLSRDMAIFLRCAVGVRMNLIVSGGTGSGKTTTLNAISAYIPEHDRIITIEDTAELQLQQDHVVSLESRATNLEGKGEVTIRQLVRNALHMRPERIIVGECRGGEALDMLHAMASGQSGSLTTAHANSPREMVARLETMVMMAGTGLSLESIREQIVSTIEIIVQQDRLRDGTRKIVAISEVSGIDADGTVRLDDIFRWIGEGVGEDGSVVGHFEATGYVPRAILQFKNANMLLPDGIFGTGVSVEREYARIDRSRKIEEDRDKHLRKLRQRNDIQISFGRARKEEVVPSLSETLRLRKKKTAMESEPASGETPSGGEEPAQEASEPDGFELASNLRERMTWTVPPHMAPPAEPAPEPTVPTTEGDPTSQGGSRSEGGEPPPDETRPASPQDQKTQDFLRQLRARPRKAPSLLSRLGDSARDRDEEGSQ